MNANATAPSLVSRHTLYRQEPTWTARISNGTTLSAAPHSAFAGVLAGLVFAGIVVLVSDRSASSARHRALMLFTASLFSLAFDAFIFGVIVGEQGCAKAWTVTMLAAGLLGLGALGIFGGISWLFDAYENAPLTRMANVITYTVAVVVGSFIQSNAKSYLHDMRETHLFASPRWLDGTVTWFAPATYVVIGVFALLRMLRSWRTRSLKATDQRESARNRRASLTSYLIVVHVVVVAVLSGLWEDRPPDQWEPATPGYIAATATVFSLMVPSLALLTLLVALPLTRRKAPAESVLSAPATLGQVR